jgi:DnaK suppressor protein
MPAMNPQTVRPSGRLTKSLFSSDELREIRSALKRQLDNLLSHARESLIATNPEENSFNDEGDRADIAVNSEIALRIAEADAKDIAQIERAIARIDERTYGICEVTGKPIERARLEFMPYATTCIEAARTMERRKPVSDNDDTAIFSF